MAALESPTPSIEQILIWYREIQSFQPSKYADSSTHYNSTHTLNSVAESHITKDTGTSKQSRFPRIVLKDTKGKELDTDSVYQQSLYEAKWRQTQGEEPIYPEEWRLPHGKLPARPDFSRHAPYLRPNQYGRKKKKHSRHKTCPASLPGSLRDFFEANAVEQYLPTSQSMQTLDTLNTYQSLPSIPQAVRKERKSKDKSFMQIVQTVRFHPKDVSEVDRREKEYVPPELCNGCQRMLSDNLLCPSCMGNRHHVHETWQTHLKPIRTGGGWTFFKRGFGVGAEELYDFHREDKENDRSGMKARLPVHNEDLLSEREGHEEGGDSQSEHAHDGQPGSSVYYEGTDYPALDQYGVTIKVSKLQDGPVKAVSQPGDDIGPWIAVEGTGKNASGVTEEGDGMERGKLYQAPPAFRLKKREGGNTQAEDPFSKDRQFNLPKGTGLDIKKSDKELTKFVEIKREVKYKPVTSTPRVVEISATPTKSSRPGTADSGVESSPVPPANSVADSQVLAVSGQLEAAYPIDNRGPQSLNQGGHSSQSRQMAAQPQPKPRQSNPKTKDTQRAVQSSQLSPHPNVDLDPSHSSLSPRLTKSRSQHVPIAPSPLDDMALTAGIPILGALPSRLRFKAPVQIPPGVKVPSYILNAVVKSYSDDQLLKKHPPDPSPDTNIHRYNTLPPAETKPLWTPDPPPVRYAPSPSPIERNIPVEVPYESPPAPPSPTPEEAENESESESDSDAGTVHASPSESSVSHEPEPNPTPVASERSESAQGEPQEIVEESEPIETVQHIDAEPEEVPKPTEPEPKIHKIQHEVKHEPKENEFVKPEPSEAAPTMKESPITKPVHILSPPLSPVTLQEPEPIETPPKIVKEQGTMPKVVATNVEEPSREEPRVESIPDSPSIENENVESEQELPIEEPEPETLTPGKEDTPQPDPVPVESIPDSPEEESEPEPEKIPEPITETAPESETNDSEVDEEEENEEEQEESLIEIAESIKEPTPVPMVPESPKVPTEQVEEVNDVTSSSEADYVRQEEEFSESEQEDVPEPEMIEEPIETEPEIEETQEAEQQTESIPPKSPTPSPTQSPEQIQSSPTPSPPAQSPLLITQVPIPKSESPVEPPESIKSESEKETDVVDSGTTSPVQAPQEKPKPPPKKATKKVVLQKASKQPPPPAVEAKPKAAPPLPPPPVVVPKKAPPKVEPPTPKPQPPPPETPKKVQPPPEPPKPPVEAPKPKDPPPMQPKAAQKPEKRERQVKEKKIKEPPAPPVVTAKTKEPPPPKEPTPPPPKEPSPEPPKEQTPPPPKKVQKKVIKGLTKVPKPEPPKKETKVFKAPPPPLPPPKKKSPTPPPPKEPTPPPPKEPTPVPTPTPTPPPKEPTPLPTPSPSPEIVFEKDSDDEDYVRVEDDEVEIEGPTPPPKSPTPTPPPPKPKRKTLPKRKPRVTLRAIAKATAPMPKSDLQEMTDPLDLLAKYCIIHPDRMPFYERIFAETIEDQPERYKQIPPTKYSLKFKEKYKNPFDLDLEEEQDKPKPIAKGTGGIVTQMAATQDAGASQNDTDFKGAAAVHKDMDDDKDSGISLPSVDKVKFRDMGLLNRAGQYEFLVGQSSADVLSKKLEYSLDRMTQKYRKLIVKKLTLQSQKKQFIFNTIKEDLPDLMRPDYDTFAKGKGKGKKKNQVLVTEMPKGSEDPLPKKKLTADEIIDRLDSKMWSMISNMPEVTSIDAQLSITDKKMFELEARMNMTDEEKKEMSIYTRDLFLKEQVDNEKAPEFRRKQSPLYQQVNPVPDIEMNVDEVEAALQRINNNLLTDREFQFVYHVLDLPGRHRLNLKLFSAVAALSEKVKQLDPITRKLINKFDFEALDIKMGKCKELFFLLDNQIAGMPDGRIDAETLAVELAAGGITPEHTQWVVNKFNRYQNGMVEFLDFLIYCPLFIEVHERIIDDPLNVTTWRLDDDRKTMDVRS